MKKYLEIAVGVMAVVGAVANVQAQTAACSANSTGTSYTVPASTDMFVAVSFTGRCSANVFLTYQQNATVMAVGTASRKGGTIFSGTSAGGGVQPIPTNPKCAASGCTAANATSATTAAFTAANSS